MTIVDKEGLNSLQVFLKTVVSSLGPENLRRRQLEILKLFVKRREKGRSVKNYQDPPIYYSL